MTRHEEIINAANEYVTKTHSPSTNDFQTAMNIAVVKAYIAAAKWADETHPTKGITTVDKAAEVFADMLIELCPELLGFGGAAKEWENEFRKRLEEKLEE